MNPLSLCLMTSVGLHGVLWQWGLPSLSKPPTIINRPGEVAVELNLIPAKPTPSPEATSPEPEPMPPPRDAAPEPVQPPPDVGPELQPEPKADIPRKQATHTQPEVSPEEPEQEVTEAPSLPAPELNAAPEPLGIEQVAELLAATSPVYPRLSRRRGEEGIVMIQLTVTAKGKAENIVITKSSGYPLLDKAALKAIRHSRFQPAQRQGAAITSTLEQTIEFKLEN